MEPRFTMKQMRRTVDVFCTSTLDHRLSIHENFPRETNQRNPVRLLICLPDSNISEFVYSDERHGEWPVVLVTNPKDSRFLAPSVEPVQKIRLSAQIRILAFSIR